MRNEQHINFYGEAIHCEWIAGVGSKEYKL